MSDSGVETQTYGTLHQDTINEQEITSDTEIIIQNIDEKAKPASKYEAKENQNAKKDNNSQKVLYIVDNEEIMLYSSLRGIPQTVDGFVELHLKHQRYFATVLMIMLLIDLYFAIKDFTLKQENLVALYALYKRMKFASLVWVLNMMLIGESICSVIYYTLGVLAMYKKSINLFKAFAVFAVAGMFFQMVLAYLNNYRENLQKEDLSGLLDDIPPELNEVLLLEEQSIKDFEKHIQIQKTKVEKAINQLMMDFSLLCYEAKKKAFDDLDKQLQDFRSNHDYLRRKLILFYPRNLSVSQISNKDAIIKEIQKANSYLEIESLIQQIQNDLNEIKVFKDNSQSSNYYKLQTLAKTVQKQCIELPSFESDLLGNKEALKDAFTKANSQFLTHLLSIKNKIKEVSLANTGKLETVLNINNQATEFLQNVIAITYPSPKFKLLYRGSGDGFYAKIFHDLCDNKGPTVVLIQSDSGKAFGGFADRSWLSQSGYIPSNNSFLFSLTEQAYYPIKRSQEPWALCGGANTGPIFGRNPGLLIEDRCDVRESKFTIGLTYQSRNHSDSKIAGGSSFKVKEIEVFEVKAGESIEISVKKSGFEQTELLNQDEYNMLRTWIDPFEMEALEFELIYKATKNGFDSSDFHKYCDGKKNTVVLIRSSGPNGRIFGGYTTQPWDRSNKFAFDSDAFLFSVTDKRKFAIIHKERAIYKDGEAGSVFGDGYDIYICSNSNAIKQSNIRLGSTYETYPLKGVKGRELAGTKLFLVSEIEVFVVNRINLGLMFNQF